MAFDAHANFAYSTVATAPSPASSGTSLTVQAGAGTLFPTPPPFNAVVWPAASAHPEKANAEIVRVTAISTDTLTITREQEGTSARSIEVGDQIRAWITNKTLTDIEGAVSSSLILEPKELGEVEGATKLTGSEGTLFYAKLKGAAEFEVAPPHEPWIAELLLAPDKYTWKVKGASWVGSEPEFGEGRVLLTILCWKGEVLLLAGVEGRKGRSGRQRQHGAQRHHSPGRKPR